MIRAMIFDLDGTLVQTEKLKALSYAKAVVELCPLDIQETEVIEAFKDVVGLTRKEVAEQLIMRFHLEESLKRRMEDTGPQALWQAFIQVRLRYYEELLGNPDILRNNQWPHNVALLEEARAAKCRLGLATMSSCRQAQRVLKILDLWHAFDFVASRDDVEHGKPDPEIYNLVAEALGVPPEECLVIEDSPSGVKAALEAGMRVVAVTTPFTREAFRINQFLEERWVVNDPNLLPETIRQVVKEHNQRLHA